MRRAVEPAAMQLELRLRAVCPAPPRLAHRPAGAAPRAFPPGDPLGLSFNAALRARPDLGGALTEAGERLCRGGLPDPLLRSFLLGAAGASASPESVRQCAASLLSVAFRRLPAALGQAWLSSAARAAADPPLRQALVALLEQGVLARAGEARGLELLRFLRGPEVSACSDASRQAAMLAQWSRQAPALVALAEDSAGADEVLAFLHLPTQRLHLLRSRDSAGSVVVLGDPADPRSLSYAQRAGRDRLGHLGLQSPDPSVASRWAAGSPLAQVELECRSAQLTRMEALVLVEWIEQSHAVSRYRAFRPRELPGVLAPGARRLDRVVESVARVISARRGQLCFERSRLRGGRRLGAEER